MADFNGRTVRRFVVIAVVAAVAFYLVPALTIAYLIFGILDISRHRKLTASLIQKYFSGNGLLTWLLSPLNLLADLFSPKNLGAYQLADLPAGHRAEIEACVKAFIENGPAIKAHVAKTLGDKKRGMLTFKWFNSAQDTAMHVPAFDRSYTYIKTIAVSVFNTRERTSWHFGPLRLTFRVLYNLDPIPTRDVFIEIDDKTYFWADNQLVIFDDTFFHRSINDADNVRYCLFMDIVRPNRLPAVFDAAVSSVAFVSGFLKTAFYKNWSFIR
jgi:hypothetical protein